MFNSLFSDSSPVVNHILIRKSALDFLIITVLMHVFQELNIQSYPKSWLKDLAT